RDALYTFLCEASGQLAHRRGAIHADPEQPAGQGRRKMKRMMLIVAFALALIATGLAQTTGRRAALEAIVAAERAFCKAAAEHGVRQAFLMNLADDSTLFRPHAVNGKQWTEASPARPGLLTWFPVYADVSRDGDLGYTTGPYEFRQSPDAKAANYGYYM